MRATLPGFAFGAALVAALGVQPPPAAAFQATTVPTDIQQPGTQPQEVPDLISSLNCDNCHAGYDAAVEPSTLWRGSMMAHAGRDPLFWATVAVAEQDFDGSGDLCLRCHLGEGWIAGRSTPTDGSAMQDDDAVGGVSCHLCHTLTDPDGSEHLGVQNAPFLAHDEGTPPEAYLGSGMYVLWPTNERLGPYDDAQAAPHGVIQSEFHRSSALCGTCHDVSNPAVGDLAPHHGAMVPLAAGTYSGVPGTPVDGKAAFNNPPFRYGVVERTYSEHVLSTLTTKRISEYPTFPPELKHGAIEQAFLAAMAADPSGDYVDGTPRTFTCQACHLPPVTGKGAKQNQAPVRSDLPWHDMTGGSTWMPAVLLHLDDQDDLLLGGPLTAAERSALQSGASRASALLDSAARLEVSGNTVRVVNLTGHKLISGYPEGRRMWLRTTWRDSVGDVLRVDGEYGTLQVVHDGAPLAVETLLDLADPHARVYEGKPGVSQEWAAKLLTVGVPGTLPLEYDRTTGAVTRTLGELAAAAPGTAWATFRFVLNDVVVSDTRIPPWGMPYDGALERSVLPVPDTQYGNPGPGGVFDHWDEVVLAPPPGAATASIELLYQSTSWEYVQFLCLANDGTNAFLGSAGEELLEAWLATGMAAPEVIATADWDGRSATVPQSSAGRPRRITVRSP